MYLRILIICLIFSLSSAQIRPGKQKPSGVVGGRDPSPGEVKYVVAVRSYKYMCGGGIIGERHILTAAHCVHVDKNGKLLQPMKIIADTKSAIYYNKDKVIEINVTRAFLPSKYHHGDPNDIAVLELKENLNFEKNADIIQKLSLPEPIPGSTEYPSYENEFVIFAGYGNTHAEMVLRNGKLDILRSGAGPLKVAYARITNSTECKRYFRHAVDDAMCLEVIEDQTRTRPQGTCKGDSGSPAVYKNSVLVGLDSMGLYCDNNRAPSLFTRVSSHIDFIKKAMNNDAKNYVVYEA